MARAVRNTEEIAVFADWLRDGLGQPGKTNAELARCLAVDPCVITRMLQGRRLIHAHELAPITEYIGVAPPTPQRSTSNLNTIIVEVVGDVADSPWYKRRQSKQWVAAVPDQYPVTIRRAAVLVRSEALNRVVPSGAYAIYIGYWDVRQRLTHGDVVVCCERPKGPLMLRKVYRVKGGYELRPESTGDGEFATIKIASKVATHSPLVIGKVMSFSFDID